MTKPDPWWAKLHLQILEIERKLVSGTFDGWLFAALEYGLLIGLLLAVVLVLILGVSYAL